MGFVWDVAQNELEKKIYATQRRRSSWKSIFESIPARNFWAGNPAGKF